MLKSKIKKVMETAGYQSFIALGLSVAFGLLIGFIILLIANPKNSLSAFFGILLGSFGEPKSPWLGFGDLLYYATPILFTGLSVGFAYKTGLFNIGASGQFMVAQFAAVAVALYGRGLGFLHWPLALIAGVLAGALWGFFPGLFKALFNVNEVISAIMFNYIGMYLTNMLIRNSPIIYNSERVETHFLPRSAFNPKFGLNYIFSGSRIDISIVFAIIIAIIIFIILNKTVFGYELKAVGYNRNASKYAGINEKKSIILSMMIAGALAGAGGALKILSPGVHYLGYTIKPIDVIAGEGFTGIPVALLGLLHPIGIIFSALFITYIQRGGFYTQAKAMIEIIDIIVALIIYFSAFTLLFKMIIAKSKAKRKLQQEDINDKPPLQPNINNQGEV